MNNWKETTLGEVAEIKGRIGWRGYTIEDLREHGHLVIGGTQIVNNRIDLSKPVYLSEEKYEESPEIKINKYDIVITKTGNSYGDVAIVDKDIGKATINPNVAIIRTRGINPYYLYYWLIGREAQHFIKTGNTASAQPAINQETLRKLCLYKPSDKEQLEIVNVIRSVNDKIELLWRQNKTLESIAQTIFKEWFVNFTVNGKKLKINSKTGIPDGWIKKGIDEIADFLNGLALQKYPPKNKADILPVIKIRELKAGITDQSDKASKQINSKYIVNDGDILFSWSGSLEVVLWCYGKGALNQHLFKVTSEKYPKWFYYYWILEHLPFFRSIAEAKATTMGHIQRHHLSEALVVVPNEAFMTFANNTMKPIFERVVLNNSEIQTLSKLRDSLLPKLMRGEIRIKNI